MEIMKYTSYKYCASVEYLCMCEFAVQYYLLYVVLSGNEGMFLKDYS